MSSTARKLIYSKINTPPPPLDGDDRKDDETSSSSSSSSSTSSPVIVLENMGASRWTDMVEVYRLVQHLCHGILLQSSSSSSFCTFCASDNSHTAVSDQIRSYTSSALEVPLKSIMQAVKVPTRRERTNLTKKKTNNNSEKDDDDDEDEEIEPYDHYEHEHCSTLFNPIDLLWHYGWPFSIIVPNPVFFKRDSDLIGKFCHQLRECLVAFKPKGRRILRGSAAQGNSKKYDEHHRHHLEEKDDNNSKNNNLLITTLPTDIVATVEENIPHQDVIIKLYQAASPPVKLFGFPKLSSTNNNNNNNKREDTNQKSASISLLQQQNQQYFLKSPTIPGLFMMNNFLTHDQEQELLDRVAGWEKEDDPNHCCSWQTLNLRRVRHFGRIFDYSTNGVLQKEEDNMVPLNETPWIKFLLDRIHKVMKQSKEFDSLSEKEWNVDQMTVSEYKPGAGIPPHIDHPENFGEIIVAVAIGAPTLFEFSKVKNNDESDKNNNRADDDATNLVVNENTKCSVLFPPRTLMIMQGPSRYEWKHSIAARSRDYLFVDEADLDRIVVDNDHPDQQASRLAACSLERERRISFTFRRVTMEEKMS